MAIEVIQADEGRDTGRLEAFSDGVFAIAVTLLALELRTPLPTTLHEGEHLREMLWHEWPAYLAFATSFTTILIMWVNHHNLFRLIRRTDHAFLLLNGLLLATVTVIPFSTNVLAEYIREPDARTAAIFYAVTGLAMAVAFNRLWAYAQREGRLLARGTDPALIRSINAQFRIGPLTYAIALVLSALQPVVGFAAMIALAIYWALPEGVRPGPK